MRIAARAMHLARTVGWQVVFVIPVVGLVVPTLYAHTAPKVFGAPFVVWYQFVLVLVGLTVTVIAFRAVERRGTVSFDAVEQSVSDSRD